MKAKSQSVRERLLKIPLEFDESIKRAMKVKTPAGTRLAVGDVLRLSWDAADTLVLTE